MKQESAFLITFGRLFGFGFLFFCFFFCEALEAHSCWELRKLELAEPEPVSDLERSDSALPGFAMIFALAEQVG